MNDYTLALMKGKNLTSQKNRKILLKNYHALQDYRKNTLKDRIFGFTIFRFVKELIRSERKTVGRLDSRFTGIDRDAAGENFEYDPSLAAIHWSLYRNVK